jgi:hypothetical protein
LEFAAIDGITTGSSMSELDLPPGRHTEDLHFRTRSIVLRQLPFLAILALAIAGVAYTNFSGKPLIGYWEFLALAIGVVSVVTEWTERDDRQARVRLVWTQALHWIAVCYDEHHAAGRRSTASACACDESRAFDVASAWHFSRRPEPYVAANGLSRPLNGSGSSRDLLDQAIGALSDFGCGLRDRPCHGFLVAPDGYASI